MLNRPCINPWHYTRYRLRCSIYFVHRITRPQGIQVLPLPLLALDKPVRREHVPPPEANLSCLRKATSELA